MYKKGDIITYASVGVCRISDVCRMDFSGTEKEYFVLVSAIGQQTVYVPSDNAALVSHMHSVMTKEETLAFISSIPKIDAFPWEEENRQRGEAFRAALADGDRITAVKIMKAVENKKKELADIGKKLYLSDDAMYKRAQKTVYDELSYVMGITYDEVPAFVESVIKGDI